MQGDNCPECGFIYDDDGSKCPNCGETILNNSSNSAQAVHRSKRLFFFTVFISVAVVLVVVSINRLFIKPGPLDQTIRTFLVAAKSGQYSKIKPYLSKDTIQKIGNQQKAQVKFARDWQHVLTRFWDPRDSDFSISDPVYESESTVVVSVQLKIGNKAVAQYVEEQAPNFGKTPIVMVRESGQWKFDSARTIARLVINPQMCEDNQCLTD